MRVAGLSETFWREAHSGTYAPTAAGKARFARMSFPCGLDPGRPRPFSRMQPQMVARRLDANEPCAIANGNTRQLADTRPKIGSPIETGNAVEPRP